MGRHTPIALLHFVATLTLAAVATPAVPLGAQQAMPALRPQELVREAQTIAVLRIARDEQPDLSGPGARWELVAEPVRQLAGTPLPARVALQVSTLARPFVASLGSDRLALRTGEHLLAFLVSDPIGGALRLQDAHHGLMRVREEGPQGLASAEPRQAVLDELRHALGATSSALRVSALRALAALGDRGAVIEATILSDPRRGAPADVRAAALELRLQLADGSALPQVVRLVESPDALPRSSAERLAWALTWSPRALSVEALNHVLQDTPHATLATAAAYVLAQTADASSAAALLAGLGRPELETQFRCVKALCRLTGKAGPGHDAFLENPEPTVAEWRRYLRRRLARRARSTGTQAAGG